MLRSVISHFMATGAVIVALCGGFTACANRDDVNSITALPHRSAMPTSAVQQRARLHERNEFDWVGLAHNKTLDDFRRELRKPSRMPGLCPFLLELAGKQNHIPVDQRSHLSEDQRNEAIATLKRRDCKTPAPAARSTSFSLPRTLEVSPLAAGLVTRISSATLEATSSYDLSERLMPILVDASVLDDTERAYVLGTLSTAQNSMEYWESVWPQFMLEVRDEYSSCLTTDSERSEVACIDPVSTESAPLPGLRLVTLGAVPCSGFNGAWEGIKATAQADADGFGGGFLGGLVTKSIPGAAQVGAIAAVGKSGWTGVKVTIGLWKCAMGYGDRSGLA